MQILRAFIQSYNRILCLTDQGEAEGIPFVLCGGKNLLANSETYCDELHLTLEDKLNPEQPCYVVYNNKKVPAEPLGIYDTAEFREHYTYDGILGATFENSRTVFRVWSPFAFGVKLKLYTEGDGGAPCRVEKMTRGERGVWTVALAGDLEGLYYTYALTHSALGEVETVDPYALSAGLNGKRGMVTNMNAHSVTPHGWQSEHKGYRAHHAIKNYTDAVIWEVHVRDFSGKTYAHNRHKFLAFTESLTNRSGEPVGLDYLVDLGVTHVHLLPVAEYATVDSTRLNDRNYNAFNWGYDPKNYNSPMGAYSTDPADGHSRILELREAVFALHSRGIGVIFDVVYNHTYDMNAPIARTVPYYYYRHDNRGNYTNGSGCGNETASERPMCRKFILDSLLGWAKNYHADGFRFDLMGLHDVATMAEIQRALHSLSHEMIIYGEGWVGGPTALPDNKQCNKWNANIIHQQAGAAGCVAVFSDITRDSIKGAVFHANEGGYVNGHAWEKVNLVKFASMGSTSPNFGTNWVASSANQVINYVSAHDNNTLWDKICMTSSARSYSDRVRMSRMCGAIVLTSRGVPFMQAGEELLRSKPKLGGGFEENSYNSPDYLNNINWEDINPDSPQKKTRDYYRGLIAFRKAHSLLRLWDKDEIEKRTHFLESPRYDVIAYTLSDEEETILIIYNPLDDVEFTLPDGKWELRVNGDRAGDNAIETCEGRVNVAAISVYCFVKKNTENVIEQNNEA